jgi:hypothetical protein
VGLVGLVGPLPIRAQARPDLCWQAAGNGSPVTLAHCGSANGQLWTLTSNGVLMNGNGYCLQDGPAAAGGLLVGFGGQCDGETGQLWAYHDATGQLVSAAPTGGTGSCAVLTGPLAPGTPVVSGTCAGGTGWSFGTAAAAPVHSAPARPQAAPHRLVVHPVTAPPVAAAQPGGVWSGLPLAILLAGLLVAAGTALVLFGRRSHKATRPRPEPHPQLDRTDDSGPYVVDVTDEVARRRASQEVVDARPTMPFDTRSLR